MLTSNKKSGPILIGTLVLVLLFAVYYYIVLPKQSELKSLKHSVSLLEQEVSSLQASQDSQQSDNEHSNENDDTVQIKIPPHKDVVKLLLSLEEIEHMTEAKIIRIDFNNYDSLVSRAQFKDPSDSNFESSVLEVEENQSVSPIPIDSLPAELQMLTFTLEMETISQDKLSMFIKELEASERIIRLDHITYSSPGEQGDLNSSSNNRVTAKIQATTFYYER